MYYLALLGLLSLWVILFILFNNFNDKREKERVDEITEQVEEYEEGLRGSFEYEKDVVYKVTDKDEGWRLVKDNYDMTEWVYRLMVYDEETNKVWNIEVPESMYNRLAQGDYVTVQEGKDKEYVLTQDGKDVLYIKEVEEKTK